MMMMKKGVALAMCLMVAVAVVEEVVRAEAVTCRSTELSPCVGAILSPVAQQPSQECCSKLREQKPCLCGYMKDPSLGAYVNSGNARNVAATCGVPIPNC